jgi:hypothetical protein
MEQVPAETTVRVVPLIEQAGDVVVKVTGYKLPAELVATKGCGLLVIVIATGEVKVMALASLVIEIALPTLLAAR